MKADTPISLADLTKMSPEEREALLSLIRDRRMRPVRIYEELSLMQAEARKEHLEKQWAKALEMFAKELERADRAMDKVQQRGTKLRAIELEIEQI
jgi:hypothetical protein|tara:strand:- start:1243 stop:1530 length:288 start_codon:yes stop_codon:yes gene_type:complete